MKNVLFTIGLILIGIVCIGNIYYISEGGFAGVLCTMFASILGTLLSIVFGIVNRKEVKAKLIFTICAVVNLYSLFFADNFSQAHYGLERGIIPLNTALIIAIIVVLVSIYRTKKLKTVI